MAYTIQSQAAARPVTESISLAQIQLADRNLLSSDRSSIFVYSITTPIIIKRHMHRMST